MMPTETKNQKRADCNAALSHPLKFVGRLSYLAVIFLAGCGTTLSRNATEQLLLSDAVDRTVTQIDFRVLANEKVYLDTSHIKSVKGIGFVNSDYIISSLRQQMAASRCLLQDKPEEADYIVEARIGTLATDGHEITYGIPASSALSTAASLLPTAPPVPVIPEISLGKKQDQSGAAKIAVFAYHRETKEPVWQSGISQAKSTAKDIWVLGAGPFQRGTIYKGTQFAGNKLDLPLLRSGKNRGKRPAVAYDKEIYFKRTLRAESVSAKNNSFPARKLRGSSVQSEETSRTSVDNASKKETNDKISDDLELFWQSSEFSKGVDRPTRPKGD